MNRLPPATAEAALRESIAREDLGTVIDIRSRVRKDLEAAIDAVAQRAAQVADDLSQDGEPVARHTAHGW